ncbi:hypothetical protein TSUD_227910, partial [Trifolium subterraneum]
MSGGNAYANRSVQQDVEREGAAANNNQQNLENWLPVSASRKAKWWYSTFHNVTAMVGAGVLSLPYALSQLGCYSVVACATSIAKGIEHHPTHYGVRSHTTAGKTFDIFNALGTIAFAFAGHSVVLEIQATLPSTEEKPSKIPMWRGVVVAYTIVILCYLTVAISGYWAFGDLVEDDVLISLQRPEWVIAVANFMVFLHVLGSYQVFAMPVFDTIESCLVQKFKFNPSSMLRLIARSIYVAVVGFLAVTFPFFGGLLGFFGGLAFSATSYIIPCVLWLYAKKPKICSFHWIASV